MMYDVTVAAVIPTYDRPDDLRRCVESLAAQREPPAEVIVVDDADQHTHDAIRPLLPEQTSLTITASQAEPGLSAARNRGVELASEPIVLFLDDDVELGEDYLTRLRWVYRHYDSPDLAGVGGFDGESVRRKPLFERIYDRTFGLDPGWSINEAGFQSWETTLTEVAEADWLSGYNASYKRSLLSERPFEQHEGGRETLEDIDMGWRLCNDGYHFLVDPGLEITHHETPITDSAFGFGAKRARNRVRIFRRHGDSDDWPLFLWCFIGDTVRHLLAPVVEGRGAYHLTVSAGMFVGVGQMLAQR